MVELTRPFERMWEWLERTGGYPGKLMFASLLVMAIVSSIAWCSNRR